MILTNVLILKKVSPYHKQALSATKVAKIDKKTSKITKKKQHFLLKWLGVQTAVTSTRRHSFFVE